MLTEISHQLPVCQWLFLVHVSVSVKPTEPQNCTPRPATKNFTPHQSRWKHSCLIITKSLAEGTNAPEKQGMTSPL